MKENLELMLNHQLILKKQSKRMEVRSQAKTRKVKKENEMKIVTQRVKKKTTTNILRASFLYRKEFLKLTLVYLL